MKIYLLAAGALLAVSPFAWMKKAAAPEVEKPRKVAPPLEKPLLPEKPIDIPVAPKPKFAGIPAPIIDDEEVAKEENLTAALKENEGFASVADIENVSCEGKTCSILASAHGDTNEEILNSIIQFLQKNPEYGLRFSKDDVKDDPKAAVITITQE